MFIVSSCSCLCPIHWRQLLSREWRCSWTTSEWSTILLPTEVQLTLEVWGYFICLQTMSKKSCIRNSMNILTSCILHHNAMHHFILMYWHSWLSLTRFFIRYKCFWIPMVNTISASYLFRCGFLWSFPRCLKSFLTHRGRVRLICISKLCHHWFRWWLGAWSAPTHYLNQCWYIVNWTLGNKFQWNLNQNTIIFM